MDVKNIKKLIGSAITVVILALGGYEVSVSFEPTSYDFKETSFTATDIPDYQGEAYVVLNDNVPLFSERDKTSTEAFEYYGELDELGRCTGGYANICQDLMPTEPRGSISEIKPTGWHSNRYDIVEGGSLYNRSHLIGFQLAGENANEKNLITGTRYFNASTMLLFENMVADYVKETNHHVLYRVIPIFDGNDLVARGVTMEAYSVEDHGEGIMFNVFAYNVQPGITIDYETGINYLTPKADEVIYGNSRSKVYHCPGQKSYEDMKNSPNLVEFKNEGEAIKAGYRKAAN